MKIIQCVLFLCVLFLSSCSFLHSKKEIQEEKIPLAQQIAKNGYEKVVYFDISSYALNFKIEDILRRTARLQHLSKTEVYLYGHADQTGIKELNMILSENRVESVKKYLVKLGVNEEAVHTFYYGDRLLAVFDETSEGFAKNRRVEIRLQPVKTDDFADNLQDNYATENPADTDGEESAAAEEETVLAEQPVAEPGSVIAAAENAAENKSEAVKETETFFAQVDEEIQAAKIQKEADTDSENEDPDNISTEADTNDMNTETK